MKKTILFASICLMILLSTQSGFSYTINDAIGDRVGDRKFEVYGIDVSRTSPTSITFSLFSNYPQSGYTVGSWATFPGDLGIDVNLDGNYEYGFALTNHDGVSAGNLYNGAQWYTSNHYAPSSGYIYNPNQIVTIQTGTPVGSGTFGWFGLPGGPDDRIDINLDPSLLSGLDGEFGLYWASATCANDYVNGIDPVPEPTTLLLLSSGLLGLIGLRRKLKK